MGNIDNQPLMASATRIERHNCRKEERKEIPVVIVGGGPTGLILSSLLSSYQIPSILLEARTPSQIAKHPQAHYINLRTMEIIQSSMPDVYRDIIHQMPQIEDTGWDAFTFSHSITGRQLARVLHPVKGIAIGQNSHGTLVPTENKEGNYDRTSSYGRDKQTENVKRCSPCDPGHLPQNKFTSILLKEAQRASKLISNTQILHGTSVTHVTEDEKNDEYPMTVHTSSNDLFQAKYVVVAEGYASKIRTQWNCDMVGNPQMQSLMNVHFRTSPSLTDQLMERRENRGMLHFVFHQELVGVFVCHGPSEWVLQFPFFPPLQSVEDFSEKRVKNMILAGMIDAGSISNPKDMTVEYTEDDVDILTIRPWTMSSTVAQSYFLGKLRRIILAGDSAHAFPPSGGFGMNTGLQDSHNLAWRLAFAVKCHSSKLGYTSADILEPYERERKHIAVQNAALSVRNYNRTLEIAKECWLYAKHPIWLTKLLQSMNIIMPQSSQRELFEAAVKNAMIPLANLASEGDLYGDQVTKGIRRILRSGGGLPLLFPTYEIGYSYDVKSLLSEKDDAAGYYPDISVGKRLCHVPVEQALWRKVCPGEEVDNEIYFQPQSLTNINSLGKQRWEYPESPRFMLLVYEQQFSRLAPTMKDLLCELHNDKGFGCDAHCEGNLIGLDVLEIYSSKEVCEERMKTLRKEKSQHKKMVEESNKQIEQNPEVVMYDIEGAFYNLHVASHSNAKNLTQLKEGNESNIMLVRPDGHIAKIWKNPDTSNKTTVEEEIMMSLFSISK